MLGTLPNAFRNLCCLIVMRKQGAGIILSKRSRRERDILFPARVSEESAVRANRRLLVTARGIKAQGK